MSGKLRTTIENENKESENHSDRKSAGVCTERSTHAERPETAPQRINARELVYILGLIEADGSFSCY